MTRTWFGTQHKGTKRTMGLMYIIISLLLNDEVHSALEVIDSPSSFFWETASHHCTNSKINVTVAIPAVNLTSMRVIDEIALKGEAWVGYFQSYKHFLFIVCVPLSVIEPYISAKFSTGRNNNRPGMCYSLCGLQGYIGLQEGVCYCIAKRNFSAVETYPFNSSCQFPLQCGNGMLCGDQGYSSISVYKEVTISSNDIKGNDSGCLIVTKDKHYEMSVVNCGSQYRHLCEAQTGQMLYLAETPEKDQWVYSIKNCAKAGKRPTTFIEDITNFIFPNVSRPLWTSVVRDLVIRNCSKTCTTIGSHSYEGFLKNTDGVIQLEFVHAGNDSRKKTVICMSEEKMQYSTSVKIAQKMTSSDPAKTMTTRTTSKETKEKMQYSTSVKIAQKMTSSDPAKTMSTRTTSKATKEKMQYSTSVKIAQKMTSSDPAKTMSTRTTSKATKEKMQYSTSVKIAQKMTSSDPAKTMSTRTTSKATKKIEYSTSEKKDKSPEMTSSDKARTKSTRTTSKATITLVVSGKKMEYSTKLKMSPKMTSSDPAMIMSTRTTSKATSTSFVSEQPSNEQGNSTKEPAETTITSATSEAPVTSLISVTTVILPVLALIAVVVALIVMCRKRSKEKASIHVEAPKQTTTEAVVPRNAESHQTYYEHEKETLNQLEENEQGHFSSEYDTLKENNAPFSAGTGNLYDTANFNIADGTYAVTLSVSNMKHAVQANSYDHVRLKKTNDGKYDHVDLQDQRNKMHDIDTNDQANAPAVDNAYYETFQENFKLHQQFEENVYDAANFHKTN